MNGLFNPQYVWSAFPHIIQGIPTTLLIAALGFLFGSVIGFACAMARIRRIPVVRRIVAVYVSCIRGTPLLVQIYIAYYGVPILIDVMNAQWNTSIDVSTVPAMVFVLIAFSLNSGAYLAETFRSAILSVGVGQLEAARSVGMSNSQALWRIVIPQALKAGIPNIANQFIMMLKDTSLAFTAAVAEIMGQAQIYAGRTSMFFESYVAAAIIYWVLCFILVLFTDRLEAFIRRNERGVAR